MPKKKKSKFSIQFYYIKGEDTYGKKLELNSLILKLSFKIIQRRLFYSRQYLNLKIIFEAKRNSISLLFILIAISFNTLFLYIIE